MCPVIGDNLEACALRELPGQWLGEQMNSGQDAHDNVQRMSPGNDLTSWSVQVAP